MKFDRLVAQIIGWANDRNLIKGSTYVKQFDKLVEELGEYAGGKARGKLEVQADALGDMMVVAIIMDAQVDSGMLAKLVGFTGAKDHSYEWVLGAIENNINFIGVDKAFLLQTQNMGSLAYDITEGNDLTEGLALVMGSAIAACLEHGLQPTVVLEDVWNIIKDRKGKMIDGVFVKEGDAMMQGGSNEQG